MLLWIEETFEGEKNVIFLLFHFAVIHKLNINR